MDPRRLIHFSCRAQEFNFMGHQTMVLVEFKFDAVLSVFRQISLFGHDLSDHQEATAIVSRGVV